MEQGPAGDGEHQGGKLYHNTKLKTSPGRRLILMAALAGLPAWAAAAAPPPAPAPTPLTTLESIHDLSYAQASSGLPVAFEATVTFFRGYRHNLFVQDGATGIFVKTTTSANLVPGDRVLIKGTSALRFRPSVDSSDVTVIGHSSLPNPMPANFDELVRAEYDSRLVTVTGIVRAANQDMPSSAHARGATLRVLTDGGDVIVELNSADPGALNGLLDAQVAVTGVAGGQFDGKLEETGVVLHASDLEDIKVLKQASTDPWSLPLTPMDQVLSVYHVNDSTRRARVSGIVTYYEPGSVAVLEDGSKSIWIKTRSTAPIRIGDRADAIGFANVGEGFLMLAASEIRDSGMQTPVSPTSVSSQAMSSSRHLFDLVSMEGQVTSAVREAGQDEYVLLSDGYMFSAIYRHPNTGATLAPMKEVPIGSKIRVTGICVLENANPFGHNVPFNILMRSPDDLTVLAKPVWTDVRHLTLLVELLIFVVIAVGARIWFVERKVRRQIAGLAYVEQRRGKILEDINSSRPLAEILERITELVSVKLGGAACWCQIVNGARLGNCPLDEKHASLRIAEHPIAARSGPAHGAIFAAFDSYTTPNTPEAEALAMGASLATLAIDTAHLYSDLVHRSEFDMLTDIQNRFSLEKHLENLIHVARQSAGIFGLLYIDLNDFKQVNDVHGHRAGDLYLQEVAYRMKRQLRPGDILARLGGDEFAVLVPDIHHRTDVEEIALRLECCFDQPFTGEGYVVHGSASVGIALYPEDGTTKDSLLSTADGAMYMVKQTKPRPRTRDQESARRDLA
jgi:diguanylate cyclase (GGDEF)-like protein